LRFLRSCLLLIVFLLFIVIGFGALYFTRLAPARGTSAPSTVQRGTVPAGTTRTVGPPAVSASGTPVQVAPTDNFDKKLADLDQLVRTTKQGTFAPFAVTFTQTEVNGKLAAELQNDASLPIQHPTFVFTPGVVTVAGSYSGNGFRDVPIVVTSGVSVQQGQIKSSVQSASVSGVSLPGFVRDQLSSQIQSALQQQSNGLPLILKSVRVDDNTITFEGTTK